MWMWRAMVAHMPVLIMVKIDLRSTCNLRELFDITKHGMKEHREEIIIV